MLLAALGASRTQSAGDVIDQASQGWGRPKAAISQASGAVGGWGGPAGLHADDEGWLAEGWLNLGAAALSPCSLQKATGDFALFALHEKGVLLASGRAGGHRPIYVAWPSEESAIACTHLSPMLGLLPRRPSLDLEDLSASLSPGHPRSPEPTPY